MGVVDLFKEINIQQDQSVGRRSQQDILAGSLQDQVNAAPVGSPGEWIAVNGLAHFLQAFLGMEQF